MGGLILEYNITGGTAVRDVDYYAPKSTLVVEENSTSENLVWIAPSDNSSEGSSSYRIYVSSIAGIEALGAPTDYSTAKTAVISLAKNLARKSAPDVRVNVLAPGNIFFENGSWDKKIKKDKKSVDEMISSEVPMKRFGTPEEVGDAAVFLCSDKAKFITGTTLVIDGGQTIGLA